MSGQSTESAQRSAHVTRGGTREAGPDPFVGPPFGPVRLRAVAEARAQALEEAARACDVVAEKYQRDADECTARRLRAVSPLLIKSGAREAAAAIRALAQKEPQR